MTNSLYAHAACAALGDPMRRSIFERLAVKPAPVGELAETLPVTRSAVSQHLRVLKEARLVADTQVGTRRIYRVDPRGIGAMRHWLDTMWMQALKDFAEFADALGDEDNRE
jgi:DNA-binding transcriptional ArsR family regulator